MRKQKRIRTYMGLSMRLSGGTTFLQTYLDFGRRGHQKSISWILKVLRAHTVRSLRHCDFYVVICSYSLNLIGC